MNKRNFLKMLSLTPFLGLVGWSKKKEYTYFLLSHKHISSLYKVPTKSVNLHRRAHIYGNLLVEINEQVYTEIEKNFFSPIRYMLSDGSVCSLIALSPTRYIYWNQRYQSLINKLEKTT